MSPTGGAIVPAWHTMNGAQLTIIDSDADAMDHAVDALYEVAFSDRSPRGYRIVCMDTTRDLPGMIELMEMMPSLETRYTEMYLSSVGWYGSDPVRRAK